MNKFPSTGDLFLYAEFEATQGESFATPKIPVLVITPSPPLSTFSVIIAVTDASNNAISGATVTREDTDVSQQTNSSGATSFDNLPSGTYVFLITKSGYTQSELTVNAGGTYTVKITPMDLGQSFVIVPIDQNHVNLTGVSVLAAGKQTKNKYTVLGNTPLYDGRVGAS